MPNYKVVDADVLDADLQTVADAIKAKAGTEEALEFPSGFASAVESIETGGGADHTVEDGLIAGTLTEYTNDRVESIAGDAVFSYNKTITSVSFPKVTSLQSGAFRSCALLITADFPSLANISESAFNGCSRLQEVNFPLVKSLGSNAFNGCANLQKYNFPSLWSVGGSSFYACSALQEVDSNIVTYLGQQAFRDCKKLTKALFPSLETTGHSVFYGCLELRLVDCGLLGSGIVKIGSSMFKNCPVLETVILRSQVLSPLSATSIFDGTPFASGGTGGTVYVPAALIEQYQTATNWSTLYAAGTCTFLPLEEYTLDGTATGEIDMAKVEAKLNELYGGATA